MTLSLFFSNLLGQQECKKNIMNKYLFFKTWLHIYTSSFRIFQFIETYLKGQLSNPISICQHPNALIPSEFLESVKSGSSIAPPSLMQPTNRMMTYSWDKADLHRWVRRYKELVKDWRTLGLLRIKYKSFQAMISQWWIWTLSRIAFNYDELCMKGKNYLVIKSIRLLSYSASFVVVICFPAKQTQLLN